MTSPSIKRFDTYSQIGPQGIGSYINVAKVAASTAENIAVPTTASWVCLTATALSYVLPDGTAAIPAADVTDGNGSAMLPASTPRWFNVEGVTNISVISATADAIITAEFYGDA